MRNAIKIPLIYFSFGIVWVITSDIFITTFRKTTNSEFWQIYVAIGFILITSLFLALLISRSEMKIEKSQIKFKTLFETSPIPAWIYDANTLKLTMANNATLKFFGYSKEEFNGLGIKDLLAPTELSRIKEIQHKLIHEESFQYECHHITSEKVIRKMIVHCQKIRLDNHEIVIANALDLTEYQIIRNHLADQAEVQEEKLEALNRSLESLSFGVSHDLRAPLRAVSGFAKIFQEKFGNAVDDEGARYINLIISESNRMNNMINDLLAFSRIQRIEKKIELLDTQQIVNSAIEEILQETGFTEIKLDIGFLPKICADRRMIKMVWDNLLNNAVRYAKSDQIPEITIWHEGEKNIDKFFIKDSGIGFENSKADKIFGIFERLGNSNKEGSGVGLAIVKMIIESHNGFVNAIGNDNKGATFCIALPKAEYKALLRNETVSN